MIIKFLIQLLVFLLQLPLILIGILILLPVVTIYNIGTFPKLVRWFDSADTYLNRDITTITTINAESVLSRYYWVALRNPLNYYGYKVLGFQSLATIPDSRIGDSTGKQAGSLYIESQGKYQYLLIHKWSATTCLKISFGWNLINTANGEWVQNIFVISPYKSYSGV